MGVFLIGSLVWMLAILIDKNRVFPKWFGYLNLCNGLTEIVVSTCVDLPARRVGVERPDRVVARHGRVRHIHGRFHLPAQAADPDAKTSAPARCPTCPRGTEGGGAMTDLAETNKSPEFVPGQPDMWAFVLFETLVFTAYFGFYLFYPAEVPNPSYAPRRNWTYASGFSTPWCYC